MLAPRGRKAKEGDVVLVYWGYNNITSLRLKRGMELHCKAGKFKHNDIIDRQLGTWVEGVSNVKADTSIPKILVLQNSSDLWTSAVPHRTQIIYDTDIAVIIFNLRIGPGLKVIEAGTGSGSLTHSLAKTVAPNGRVFTFDFHKDRCLEARRELRDNGIDYNLVSCHWSDVCGAPNTGSEIVIPDCGETNVEDMSSPSHGFCLPPNSVDAVFLDLPSPWSAITNVLQTLKPGGMLCTFSPCIEQTQRTAERLREPPHEFVDIRTVECLTKFFEPVFKRETKSLDEGSDGVSTKPREKVKFRSSLVSKGHSAYLTFARRRLPFVDGAEDNLEDEDDTREDDGEAPDEKKAKIE